MQLNLFETATPSMPITLFTARAVMARYGTVSIPKLKDKFGEKLEVEKTTPKNRYIYFLGSKSQKKKLKGLLKWKTLPYPKQLRPH